MLNPRIKIIIIIYFAVLCNFWIIGDSAFYLNGASRDAVLTQRLKEAFACHVCMSDKISLHWLVIKAANPTPCARYRNRRCNKIILPIVQWPCSNRRQCLCGEIRNCSRKQNTLLRDSSVTFISQRLHRSHRPAVMLRDLAA
jgi:hypothetical protein